MNKPFIFVSCGQFSDAEKKLGKDIVKVTKAITRLDAFFAEEVQDLNGLDSNILGALRDCSGFITVLHPRGEIVRPDGSGIIRASVWIEQEIAIAAYIRRVEKRDLPVIAFIHESVGREGIRDLLHLNPISFAEASDVLAALPACLEKWKGLTAAGRRVLLRSVEAGYQQGHCIGRLEVILENDSNENVSHFNGIICVPASILNHWSAIYPSEDKANAPPHHRCFRIDETGRGSIPPHDTRCLFSIDYCTQCALGPAGGIAALVAEAEVDAKVWIDGVEYAAHNTIKGVSADREARGSNH